MTLDPTLLSGVPFQSRTAALDLSGQIFLLCRAITEKVSRDFGVACSLYPLGGADLKSESYLAALQAQLSAITTALALAPSPDVQSFDLDDESEWASWTYLVSGELNRLKLAAGVA